jgi:hypothetical protein
LGIEEVEEKILGIIRSLEAFEIELLLGTPIGLQVFSTKIHE